MPHPRRPREGPPGRSLPHRPRHARHRGRHQPSPEPLEVRRQAPEVRTLRRCLVRVKFPSANRFPIRSTPSAARRAQARHQVHEHGHDPRQEVDRRGHRLRRVRPRRASAPRRTRSRSSTRRSTTSSRSSRSSRRRVGGSTYQVPVDVRPERSQALGMRWLVIYSRDRGEKTMRREARRRDPRCRRTTAATR